MKRIFCVILIAALFIGSMDTICFSADTKIRLEAENTDASSMWSERILDSASGGKLVVASIESYGEWNIEINAAGEYSISAIYATNKSDAKMTLTVNQVTVGNEVSLSSTGSNSITTAKAATLASEYVMKEGTYKIRIDVKGAQIAFDYVDIVKTADYSGNKLDGNTVISADKYDETINTEISDENVKMSVGSYSIYKVSAKTENVYGFGLDADGDAVVNIFIDNAVVYSGKYKKNEMFEYRFSDKSSDMKIEITSGELTLKNLDFELFSPEKTEAKADYKKYEFENYSDCYFKNGINKGTGGTGYVIGVNINDWFDFLVDISALGAGQYKVTISYATPSLNSVNIAADSGVSLSGSIPSTGNFNTYKTAEIGIVTLTDENDKFRFTISTGGMMVDYFALEKVDVTPEFEFMTVGGDVPAINSLSHRGSDYMELIFSYYIDSSTVNSDSVILKNGETVIPCQYSTDGNIVRMLFTRTLNYNSEYTLIISDSITGTNGLKTNAEVVKKFMTGDEDNDVGTSTVIIDDYSSNYENIFVCGKILSSKETGIAGRSVTASAYEKIGNVVQLNNALCVSQENGSYEMNFTIAEGTQCGTIKIVVSDQYSQGQEFAVNYVSRTFENDFINLVSRTTTCAEVEQLFKANAATLEIDIENDLKDVENTDGLYSRFVGKKFETLDLIIKEYRRFINYYDTSSGIKAEDYSLLIGGTEKNGSVVLLKNAAAVYNVNILQDDYYVLSIVSDASSQSKINIYFGDELMCESEVYNGKCTLCTLNLNEGKKSVTIKNVSDKSLSFSEFYISPVDTDSLKRGFGSIKKEFENYREGEGVGYYFKNGVNVSKTDVGMNNGDWFYYDITTAGTGTYKLVIKYSTPSNTNIIFKTPDGKNNEFEVASSGSWTNSAIKELGTIKLTGENTWVYVTTTGGISVDYFTLERIDTPLSYYTTLVNGNKTAENDEIKRGTDVFELHFTSCPIAVDGTQVYLKGNDRLIGTQYEIKDNIIMMKLLETLDYNTDYTLYIANLKSTNGQNLTNPVTVSLKTASVDSDGGKDNSIINETYADYENISITGVVNSSCGVPISGREVTVSAKDREKKDIILLNNITVSKDNGAFSLNCGIPQGTVYGKVYFSVMTEYGTTPVDFEVAYISASEEKTICDELCNTSDAEGVKLFFSKYEYDLDISVSEDMKNFELSEQTEFYGFFVGKSYTDVLQLKKDYKRYVVTCGINNSETSKEIAAVLQNNDYITSFGLDYGMLNKIKINKNAMLAEILGLEKTTVLDKLSEQCVKISEKYFLKEYGKNTVQLAANGASVYTGQGIELGTGFKASVSDVTEFNLIFTCDDSEIFDKALCDGNKIFLSENGKVLTYKTSLSGDEITAVDKIFLTAPGKTGNYIIGISGSVKYKITASDGCVYTVEDHVEAKNITITVSMKKSSSPGASSYPAGGTGGGSAGTGGTTGASGGTTSSGTLSTGEQTENKYVFLDLQNCKWAEDSIYFLLKKGIISENDNSLFNPDSNITREEFVKLIVCAFGLTDYKAVSSFDDVNTGEWYYVYAASAEKYGIITGDTENNFGVGKEINRQDMAVIINRVLILLGYYIKTDSQDVFSDYDEISDYAKEAVLSVQQKGIINGIGDNIFSPKSCATRAQAAKMMYGILNVCR